MQRTIPTDSEQNDAPPMPPPPPPIDLSKLQEQKVELDSRGNIEEADVIEETPSPVKQQPVSVEELPGRNEACPCGSGKKYKQCHGKND